MREPIPTLLVVALTLLSVAPTSCQLSGPMTCSTTGYYCPAYLYYVLGSRDNVDHLASLFSVKQDEIKQFQDERNLNSGGVLVSVNCSCSGNLTYLAEARYRVNPGDNTGETSLATGPYGYLAYQTRQSYANGQPLQITSLYCGCIDYRGQPLLSYVVQDRDFLKTLAQRFGGNVSTIVSINNITDPDYVVTNKVYYFHIDESGLKPFDSSLQLSPDGRDGDGGIALGAIVGIALAGLLLTAATGTLVFFLHKRKLWCYRQTRPSYETGSAGSSPYTPRSVVSKGSSWDFLGRLLHRGHLGRQISSLNDNVKRHIALSLSNDMNGLFGMEKPIIFGYDEVVAATVNFKDSNQLGVGAFGSVYFGLLRDQEVAVKKMKATKTKEFLAELKVLCKVHHTNLVELIGYSVSEDELFLVYEYAENRAVNDRLHDPLSKGFTPLTWIARVQIALDAATGLEYIHEHTTAHYVHRDVKTSNILIDGYFRAKVADFGFARLVEQSNEGEPTTRAVGTFGYLAPEYLRYGKATAKTDVYAFGVVLFELITGEEALLRRPMSEPSRRSLIYIMLSALGDCSPSNFNKLKAVVDPLLMDIYPLDSVSRMAILGKECVEEDPLKRPDMKQVVFVLSQVLLSSIEWEATLAGNSQIFSGLLQGR